jgi:coatomer subunit beta'
MSSEKPSDGERLSLAAKELDVCEIYPQSLEHNSNGRFAVVTGDGEYIIYTALAWRKKSFGNCLDFVWAMDSGEYAVRETPTSIKLFKDFKETRTFKPPFAADALLGGALLCVRAGEVCFFFDWAECRLVRRIDVQPKSIKWSETGELCVLVCEDSFFVLRYNRDTVTAAFEKGGAVGEDGVDDAFTVVHEISEQV